MHFKMMMCVYSHPLVLIFLLFLTGGGSGLSIRVANSLFQLALDTPAPAEPTPTQASRHSQLCEGKPCLNGASCLALSSSQNQKNTFEYTCSCTQGFTGRNCEVRSSYFVVCLKSGPSKNFCLKETQQNHNSKVFWYLNLYRSGMLASPLNKITFMRYCGKCMRLIVSLINLCILLPLLHLAVCCGFFYVRSFSEHVL